MFKMLVDKTLLHSSFSRLGKTSCSSLSRKSLWCFSFLSCLGLGFSVAHAAEPSDAKAPLSVPQPVKGAKEFVLTSSDAAMLEDIEHRTFLWFWEAGDPKTGLVPDRYPSDQVQASVASIGFGLTAYGIGAERGYITHAQAVARTLATLRYLKQLPQNDSVDNASGFHGFFYHFLKRDTGLRFNSDIELSSIDTALLMQGVLFAESYYTAQTPEEKEIRSLANALYQDVDWPWLRRPDQRLSMGWSPEHQFIPNYWEGYSEGMMAYVLGLGSAQHPLQPASWVAWLSTNNKRWGEYYGQTLLNFASLFGHQYSHSWIDFRGIQDDWNRQAGIDYFENSRRAAYAQRAYATANPGKWQGYGPDVWGLTASDGPGELTETQNGLSRHFLSYSARGAGRDYTQDDGTIAPTAAGGSVAFAPEIAVPALKAMKHRYGSQIYGKYGFVDAFNPSFHHGTKPYWADTAYLGIDQGPILLMLENRRSGFVWSVMKRSAAIRTGLQRAGFRGGWLDNTQPQAPDGKPAEVPKAP